MSALRCENLVKVFGGVEALSGVTLSFPASGIVAIIGPNGAGKTTLLNVVTGFARPDAGSCWLGQSAITGLPPYAIARAGIARTFQDLRLVGALTALENILLAFPRQAGERLFNALTGLGIWRAERENLARASKIIEQVGLGGLGETAAGELSYGQQKLLTIGGCLATDARVLFFDEPVAGVHPEMISQIVDILDKLRDSGRLVIFIEHDIDTVRRVADWVVVMDHGRVVTVGPPTEILAQPEIMELYVV